VSEPAWRFPTLPVRDLDGRDLTLPADLEGERNVVVLAFEMRHQRLVDSWIPWLEDRAARDDAFRYYEVPTIGTGWRPVRSWIDGGMRRGIPDPAVRRRTLTAYVPLGPVTAELGITDTSDVWVVAVDAQGAVRWRGRGPYTPAAAGDLGATVDAMVNDASPPGAADPAVLVFPFEFEGRFAPLLRVLGVAPANSEVVVTPERFVARFGRWVVDTPLTNIADACSSGPYRSYRAIGARGSLKDRGATFGSTTTGGVCVLFREPVPGLDPLGLVKHPGLTVTVADRDGLADALRRRADLA
jgi:hypothetical protein